jgi:N-acylglucosamine 2-epimerase
MIMLATARAMASCAPEPEKYNVLAREYLDKVIHGGFLNDEVGALLEHVSPDGEFVNTPMGRTVNPGHSLETAWFLMVEGMVDNNQEALEVGKKIIDITMPFGLDKKHGGIISFCDVFGKPSPALEWNMKLWWPQNEAIIANKMAYEIFKEEKYKQAYESILEYTLDKFADKENGEWYGYLNYDSTVSSSLKGNLFKGPFHIPRMFMILNEYQNGNILNFFK